MFNCIFITNTSIKLSLKTKTMDHLILHEHLFFGIFSAVSFQFFTIRCPNVTIFRKFESINLVFFYFLPYGSTIMRCIMVSIYVYILEREREREIPWGCNFEQTKRRYRWEKKCRIEIEHWRLWDYCYMNLFVNLRTVKINKRWGTRQWT